MPRFAGLLEACAGASRLEASRMVLDAIEEVLEHVSVPSGSAERAASLLNRVLDRLANFLFFDRLAFAMLLQQILGSDAALLRRDLDFGLRLFVVLLELDEIDLHPLRLAIDDFELVGLAAFLEFLANLVLVERAILQAIDNLEAGFRLPIVRRQRASSLEFGGGCLKLIVLHRELSVFEMLGVLQSRVCS